MKHTILDDILTEGEKKEIAKFLKNDTMQIAVKKVVLHAIYFDGTLGKNKIPNPIENFALVLASNAINNNVSSEKLGKKVEAALGAVELLEKGWLKLNRFIEKKEINVKDEPMPGR